MNPVLAAAQANAAHSRPEPSFQVYRSQGSPPFCQLSLEDGQGYLAH